MIKKPKKSQKAKRKFASQTLSKKAKFVVFGLKKANMATLGWMGNSATARRSDDVFFLVSYWLSLSRDRTSRLGERYSVLRNSVATLVVTLSTRDYVESEIEVTHQCVSFLSVWIRNIIYKLELIVNVTGF